ncbi:hypothetical protein KIH39_24775 [Telmatocola sphagniphila]|uniref:Transglutaminase-like domain-containing protein n=1 Tax=Telmatocola sphagniphila TaxID=1123043 RepID=A0A8E6B593_9BACT|nr:transglutaminase domain-containing protein [Telmatocola sphagniphila]QVL32011.1 hypothetical protein KIH39_24775 [Telmatocola sphagniphila]
MRPLFLCCLLLLSPAIASAKQEPWWSEDVNEALAQAGGNRPELEMALNKVPKDQRKGMGFLVANMPSKDLTTLKAKFLLENVALAYEARNKWEWAKKVPEELFLNDVLPYASITEKREDWRKEMMATCEPLVKEAKTLTDAVQALNMQLFKKLNVKYSTQRKKADQSPSESISTGLASCSGLSILLVDGCRSVGIPARIVGIPQWANKPGNHTWVEVWDKGWHFTGACEADPQGLDRGWFIGDAALAKKDSKMSAIYASSFKKTKTTFPMIWSPSNKDVFAENVTERYTTKSLDPTKTRVMIRVWQENPKKRAATPVTLTDLSDGKNILKGISKDEKADTNDLLTFDLPHGHEYRILAGETGAVEATIKTEKKDQLIVDLTLKDVGNVDAPKLSAEQIQQIEKAAQTYFAANEKDRKATKFDSSLNALLSSNEAAVRAAVWKAYQTSPIQDGLKADHEKKIVTHDKYQSAYTVKTVGKKPANGWGLFIAMHGGGNAPKSLNDSQWKTMQIYYKDQPDLGGYLYVALRAPNDTWNGFYDDYVCPLIVNLIKQFTLFEEVDPDKVFIMGYSHGGYGAFYLGPKMPDRFAAIHASAAAPTDGTISAKNLRNTRFTYMIGGLDTAYGRRERCEKFAAEIEALKKANPGDYSVEMELKEGRPHSGLPDRDKIKDMISYTRKPSPKHLTWEMKDSFLHDHYWLYVEKPANEEFIDAKIESGKIVVTAKGVKEFSILLDSRLVTLKDSIEVEVNGKTTSYPTKPSLEVLCRTMAMRGDPQLAGTVELKIAVP